METIKDILMRRDGLSETEANNRIDEARQHMYELLDSGETDEAYEICNEHFGLEPDYIQELMG